LGRGHHRAELDFFAIAQRRAIERFAAPRYRPSEASVNYTLLSAD
jgi:hypothetical protein